MWSLAQRSLLTVLSSSQPPFDRHDEVLHVREDGVGGERPAIGEFVDRELRHVHRVEVNRPYPAPADHSVTRHEIARGDSVKLGGQRDDRCRPPCESPHSVLGLVHIPNDFRKRAVIPNRPSQHDLNFFLNAECIMPPVIAPFSIAFLMDPMDLTLVIASRCL